MWWRALELFANPVFALAMVVVLPVVVAIVLGLLVFRQRVRGAIFAVCPRPWRPRSSFCWSVSRA